MNSLSVILIIVVFVLVSSFTMLGGWIKHGNKKLIVFFIFFACFVKENTGFSTLFSFVFDFKNVFHESFMVNKMPLLSVFYNFEMNPCAVSILKSRIGANPYS